MTYLLTYGERAERHIEAVPRELIDSLEYHLFALARTPVKVSVPDASPPFPRRGQLYHFYAVGSGGATIFFTVIFQYSQDETALHILSVTWREWIEE